MYKMIIDIIVLLLKCAQLTRPAGGREGGRGSIQESNEGYYNRSNVIGKGTCVKRASGRTAPPAERVLSDPPLVVLLSFSCTGRGRGEGEERREGGRGGF